MDNSQNLQPGSEPMVKTMPGTSDTSTLQVASTPADDTISPIVPAATSPATTPLPKFKSQAKPKRLAWLISTLVILVIIGAGAWFYVAYGQAWWLNKGADLPNWEHYKESASLSLKLHDITDENGKPIDQDFLGLGLGEDFSLEDASISVIYNNHQSANQSSGEAKLILSLKDFSFNFATVFKKIDKDIYIKPELNQLNIPALQNPLDLGNEWVLVNTDDIDKWTNESGAAEANKTVDEYLADSKKKEEEFAKRVVEQKFFTYQDGHESKTTPSGNIKKFEYSVATGKLDPLVKTLDELMYDNKMKDSEELGLRKFLEAAKVSIWINTKTRFIQEINLDASNISFKDDSGSWQFDVKFSYEISEAEAQTVTKPEPNIKFLDFSNRIMSQFFSPENYLEFDNGADLTVDTDADGLYDAEEELYGTDPEKADTDADGYSDFEEIENGYNPLGPGRIDTIKM